MGPATPLQTLSRLLLVVLLIQLGLLPSLHLHAMLLGQLLILLEVSLGVFPLHLAYLPALLHAAGLAQKIDQTRPWSRTTTLGLFIITNRIWGRLIMTNSIWRCLVTNVAVGIPHRIVNATTGATRRSKFTAFSLLDLPALLQANHLAHAAAGRLEAHARRRDIGLPLHHARICVAAVSTLHAATVLHPTNVRLAKLCIGLLHVAVDLGVNVLLDRTTSLARLAVSTHGAA